MLQTVRDSDMVKVTNQLEIEPGPSNNI